jgi:hypothetical protein
MFKKIYYKIPSKFQIYLSKLASKFISSPEENFLKSTIGNKHGLTINDKLSIIKKLKYSLVNVESATDFHAHILIMSRVLELNKAKNCNTSTVVECGTFKGATAIVLSIACKITNRKLIIYDSFEGLPNSEREIGKRNYPHLKFTGHYSKGMYSGSLEEVKKNIYIYGDLSVCEFRKGFFSKTLPRHKEKIDFLFLDVDLVSSTKDCIKYLWPYLSNNSYAFTDDACDIDVVKVWFDNKWWKKNLKLEAPGFIGSGCGLPINLNSFSSLGYITKNPDKSSYSKISWLK